MRLISVNALKEWIENWFVKAVYWLPYNKSNNISIPDLYNILEKMPTVDAEPVRHGKFVGTEYDGYADGYPVYYEWKCSQCGCVFEEDEKPTYKYCPNCGAKMDEEEENENK